jgi:hypothetical protein
MSKIAAIIILALLAGVVVLVYLYLDKAKKELADATKKGEEPSNIKLSFGIGS